MITITKKLQSMGGSIFVVLPMVWVKSHGLKPHDYIKIQLDDTLTIVPLGNEKKPQ